MINDVVSFGKINTGSSQMSGTKFVFAIDKNCREHLKSAQDPIEFTLKIQNGTNSVNEKFLVDVFAPEIEIGNQKITWTSNGNTTVEAGETVKMNIDLMNIGKAVAKDVYKRQLQALFKVMFLPEILYPLSLLYRLRSLIR